jgi:hypothetical protein
MSFGLPNLFDILIFFCCAANPSKNEKRTKTAFGYVFIKLFSKKKV